MRLVFVRSKDQLTNILTKTLATQLFEDVSFKLSIEDSTIQLLNLSGRVTKFKLFLVFILG